MKKLRRLNMHGRQGILKKLNNKGTLIGILLSTCLLFFGLEKGNAFFFQKDKIGKTSIESGTLSFDITGKTSDTEDLKGKLIQIAVTNTGSLPMQISSRSLMSSIDCKSLFIKSQDGILVHYISLPQVSLDVGEKKIWEISVIPKLEIHPKIDCEIRNNTIAWQTNFKYPKKGFVKRKMIVINIQFADNQPQIIQEEIQSP